MPSEASALLCVREMGQVGSPSRAGFVIPSPSGLWADDGAERKKATPDSRLYGFRLMRLLMIFFHPAVLLHGLLFHLLQLGLLFGSEHTIDLAME